MEQLPNLKVNLNAQVNTEVHWDSFIASSDSHLHSETEIYSPNPSNFYSHILCNFTHANDWDELTLVLKLLEP